MYNIALYYCITFDLCKGLVVDENSSDPSRGLLPLLVEHSNESIVGGGFLAMIPFFGMRSDEVIVIHFDSQNGVYSLERR